MPKVVSPRQRAGASGRGPGRPRGSRGRPRGSRGGGFGPIPKRGCLLDGTSGLPEGQVTTSSSSTSSSTGRKRGGPLLQPPQDAFAEEPAAQQQQQPIVIAPYGVEVENDSLSNEEVGNSEEKPMVEITTDIATGSAQPASSVVQSSGCETGTEPFPTNLVTNCFLGGVPESQVKPVLSCASEQSADAALVCSDGAGVPDADSRVTPTLQSSADTPEQIPSGASVFCNSGGSPEAKPSPIRDTADGNDQRTTNCTVVDDGVVSEVDLRVTVATIAPSDTDGPKEGTDDNDDFCELHPPRRRRRRSRVRRNNFTYTGHMSTNLDKISLMDSIPMSPRVPTRPVVLLDCGDGGESEVTADDLDTQAEPIVIDDGVDVHSVSDQDEVVIVEDESDCQPDAEDDNASRSDAVKRTAMETDSRQDSRPEELGATEQEQEAVRVEIVIDD